MSWREALRPASFRGAAFFVDDAQTPIGRRVVVHEYSQRDFSYPEDNGKLTRVYTMAAFVIGPNCFELRDALLTALEQAGPGDLVHPWLGTLKVQAGACEVTHQRHEGGMVRFSLTFHDAHDVAFPVGTANTGKQVHSSAQGLLNTSIDRYQQASRAIHLAQLSAHALMRPTQAIFDVLQRHDSPLFSPLLKQFSSAAALAHALIAAPSTMVEGVNTLKSSAPATRYADALSESFSALQSFEWLKAQPQPVGREAIKLSAAMTDLVTDLLIVDTVQKIGEMPVSQPALHHSQPQSAPSLDMQIARPVQPTAIPVTDDLARLAKQVQGTLWQQSLSAPREHFQALTHSRIKTAQHLRRAMQTSSPLVNITLPRTIPALVLAYERYGTAHLADEIVQRNRIAHPGFLPTLPLTVRA